MVLFWDSALTGFTSQAEKKIIMSHMLFTFFGVDNCLLLYFNIASKIEAQLHRPK
jgi:hypothetical protein